MATTDAYKVPITITSRAQTFTFNLVASDIMVKHLKQICEKEGIKITDDALAIIVKRGGGSFRDSLSLLDQISSLSDDEITKEMVTNAMGLPQDEKIRGLLDAYTNSNFGQITSELKALLLSGVKPETLVDEIIANIVENPTPSFLPLLAELPNIKAPYAEAKLLVAFTGALAKKPQLESPSPQVVLNKTLSPSQNRHNQDTIDGKKSDVAPSMNSVFAWDSFAQKVQEMNDAVYLQLMKTQHELIGNALHIYPRKRIIRTILSRDNNKRILIEAAGGNVKITIHDENDTPNDTQKDETLNKISAIMGGEVENDGGGSPF